MTKSAEKDFATEVVERLRAAGYEALWAGGCVRDLMMHGQPTDYDVATSATPLQVRELFGRRRTLPVGVAFGVVIVLGRCKAAGQVEVATFRTDASYSDGRHPDSVQFSTAEKDAQRRDFTINGMFLDPLKNKLIDYVAGMVDLRQGVVRAIGDADQRIGEDKLRMLRAVRFAARFGFVIDPATRAAVVRHAAEIYRVSGERIAIEIRKTLATERAAWAVAEWAQVGLLPHILPEVAAGWTAVAESNLKRLDAIASDDWLGRLAYLLWLSVGNPTTQQAASLVGSLKTRLKLSNEECESLRFALTSQPLWENAESQAWSRIQPQLIARHADTALAVLTARWVDDAAGQQTLAWLRQCRQLPAAQLDPPPLVDGGDLIDNGLRPGPEFSRLLAEIRQRQLDGQLSDRDAALCWLRTHQG